MCPTKSTFRQSGCLNVCISLSSLVAQNVNKNGESSMMNATCHSDVDSLCEGSITHIPAGQTGLGLQLNVADPRRGHANGTDVGLKKADYSAHEHVIVLALFTDRDDQYEALFEELA